MLSSNEWSKLKTVIVGDATGARIPSMEKSLRTVNYADKLDVSDIKEGSYPQQVIDEANEDLEKFSSFLTKCDVKVLRPSTTVPVAYYNYCPRDSVLVLEHDIIHTPMPLRSRALESVALTPAIDSVTTDITEISIRIARPDALYNEECVGNPDVLALTEIEPAFDAANILRANNDLFYLVSNSGNKAGAEVLRRVIDPKYKVWEIEGVYSYMHLDSTICLLREGLVLINPSRIKNINQLPPPLRDWKIIACPPPVDIGHYPGYCNASKWINMNLFSVSPDLVVLEENQHPLRKVLEKHQISCEMLPMRQQRTLGGGFHCVTLDLQRE